VSSPPDPPAPPPPPPPPPPPGGTPDETPRSRSKGGVRPGTPAPPPRESQAATQKPPPPPKDTPPPCPNCGAPTKDGQQVCLDCGHDLTRSYTRARGTRTWIAAGIAAVLAVGIGAGFAIGALSNDKQKKDAKVASAKTTDTVPPATAIPPAALSPSTPSGPTGVAGASGPTGPSDIPTTPAPSPPVPPATAIPGGPGTTTGGGIASWPSGKTAYTVVLVSAKKKAQADAKAHEAISRGIDAGVLHSNDYSSLNPGYWVVFAGQYDSADQARSKLDEYSSKGFPGGYPRQVKK
jgi:predicted nucleic acid-binding Zn ribbon protein